MEVKHAVFFLGLVFVLTIGRAFCRRSGQLRDVCAFLLVFGTTQTGFIDINFMSREWYRGTTRGIEASWLDLIWILLLLSLPPKRDRTHWLPGLGPMLVFLGYNALVVAYSDPAIFGIFELSKMVRQLGVFITMNRFVRSERDIGILIWALVLAIDYEFVTALRQRFIGHVPRVPGTLAHANSLSMYELISIPVLIAVSTAKTTPRMRYVSAATGLLGMATLLFTVSRNGILTLVLIGFFLAVACGSFRGLTLKHVFLGTMLSGIILLLLGMTYGDFKSRFEAEGFDKEYGGKVWEGRGAYLVQAKGIVEREPFGCGLNNWSWCVSNRYGPIAEQYYIPYLSADVASPRRKHRRHAHIDGAHAAPAHSLYAITLGETGWLGVILLGVVWIRWFWVAARFLLLRSSTLSSRFCTGVCGALIGAFCQSFSEWEVRQTPLAFLLHMLLGAAAATHTTNSTKPHSF